MSYIHITLIIAIAAILKVSPQVVDVSPNRITTDVGDVSVTFTCTVELNPVSATSQHWIRWSHSVQFLSVDKIELANNDTVFDKDKYSLQGMSSTASNSIITQSLTIHGIEEDDNGIYYCYYRYFGGSIEDSSYLIVRNVISQVHCFYYVIGQEDLGLFCSCDPGDPPITLQWIDKDGNLLAAETQWDHYSSIDVTYTVNTKTLYQGKRFTCIATSSGSVTTQQCIGTPIRTAEDTIHFSFTYHQSTVGVAETTEMSITSNSNDESSNSYLTSSEDKHNNTVTLPTISQSTEEFEVNGITTFISQNILTKVNASDKDNNTDITLISVFGAISILANVVFLCYTLIKNGKKKNKTEVGKKHYATYILSQVCSKQQKGVGTFKQEVGDDGYMEPIKVGENGYMEPIKVGEDGYMEPIKVGENGYMEPNKVGEDGYMEPIKVGEDGYMEPPAHIQDPYEQIKYYC